MATAVKILEQTLHLWGKGALSPLEKDLHFHLDESLVTA